MSLFLADDQFHIPSLLHNLVSHRQCFMDSHPRIVLSMGNDQRHRYPIRMVDGRDLLEEFTNNRVRLVSVLYAAASTTVRGSVLKERWPVRDTVVGETARELGREMNQACLTGRPYRVR